MKWSSLIGYLLVKILWYGPDFYGISSVIWMLFFFFCISGRYTGNNNNNYWRWRSGSFFEVGWVEKVCSKKLAFTKLKWYHPDILHFKCAARKKRNLNFTSLRDHSGGYWTLVVLWGSSCSWPIYCHMGSGDTIFYQYGTLVLIYWEANVTIIKPVIMPLVNLVK